MGITESDKELIERCVGAEPSEEDRLLFEERCKDPLFKEEVEITQMVVNQIIAAERDKLKRELHQHLTSLNLPGKKPSSKKTLLYAAAAIAFLLVIAYFILSTRISEAELYAEYYVPFPVAATRGNSDEEWRNLYSKEDYANAEKAIFRAIEFNDNPGLYLVLGNCYLNLNETGKAKNAFARALTSGDTVLIQHATWYFALALLKEGDLAGCRKELEKLEASPYAFRAHELIQKMDQ